MTASRTAPKSIVLLSVGKLGRVFTLGMLTQETPWAGGSSILGIASGKHPLTQRTHCMDLSAHGNRVLACADSTRGLSGRRPRPVDPCASEKPRPLGVLTTYGESCRSLGPSHQAAVRKQDVYSCAPSFRYGGLPEQWAGPLSGRRVLWKGLEIAGPRPQKRFSRRSTERQLPPKASGRGGAGAHAG